MTQKTHMSEKKTEVKNSEAVPYFVHEGIMTRMERTNHRLWVMCILLVIVLVATNLSWIIYESQFEYYEEQIVEQESESGNNNFIGHDGDITNGKADSND